MLRLGQGIAAGLAVVTVIVLAERLLYSSIFDASGDYRVSGPFSSMRVGGGHIGAYAALALPFVLSLLDLRPRLVGAVLSLGALLAGGYTLAVSFARTAYAAGSVGMLVTGLALPGRSTWRDSDPGRLGLHVAGSGRSGCCRRVHRHARAFCRVQWRLSHP